MRHLATAKPQGHFNLVAFAEEFHHRPHFNIVVVIIDVRAHLDFLDVDCLLLLARLVRLLLRNVFELAVIQNLADRRIGVRRYFDQIHPRLVGPVKALGERHDADHFPIFIDKSDLV